MKRIAITQRIIHAEKGADRDALEQDYVRYWHAHGAILIPIPNALDDVAHYLDAIKPDGIILSGGNDVDPAIWGGTREAGVTYATARDATERAAIEWAIAHRVPVWCECRGAQLCNAHFGGSLRRLSGHVGADHPIAGELGSHTVNSYHGWGIGEGDLAPSLLALAHADDGSVEMFRHPQHPIVGILWHPERQSPDIALNERLAKAYLRGSDWWSS